MKSDEMDDLKKQIEKAFANPEECPESKLVHLFQIFKDSLNTGAIRAAEKTDDDWQVNHWVKKGILLGFRIGRLVEYSINDQFRFFDKDTFPLKNFKVSNNIRQVPGGSTIRDGAYVAPGVVIMPPAYINVGAYVDENTMVDSHALVGSCAQIGKNVHLSAGSQIGGVLEPVGALPVVIEDNVLVGGNCGIYDGTMIREHAVLGAGTILTGSTPIYDAINKEIIRKTEDSPLVVPEGAVVVPGSRALKNPYANEHGLSVYSPILIKYRDEKTAATTALEESLR